MKKLGDATVAITVVACSAVLLGALAFALNGNPFVQPRRTLRAQFVDITGIQRSSLVKYGGAVAGSIHSIRMLTPEDRLKAPNPDFTVEAVISLNDNVPELSEGLYASISSDTLLADKFVLLEGGSPSAPVLADGAYIPTLVPTTFDQLLRKLNSTLNGMNALMSNSSEGEGLDRIRRLMDQLDSLISEARGLIGGADTLVTEGRGLVKNGNGLVDEADQFVADGRGLLQETRDPVKKLLDQLSDAASSLDAMAARAHGLVKDNEGNISDTAEGALEVIENLQITVQNAREFIESLRRRPQQIIWGPGRQRPTPEPQR